MEGGPREPTDDGYLCARGLSVGTCEDPSIAACTSDQAMMKTDKLPARVVTTLLAALLAALAAPVGVRGAAAFDRADVCRRYGRYA